MHLSFHQMPCKSSELQLCTTLMPGQSFRWRETGDNIWTGVLADCVWTLSQTDDHLLYTVHTSEGVKQSKAIKRSKIKGATISNLGGLSNEKCEELLRDYFQLHINVEEKYNEWRSADDNFCRVATKFPGTRILRQDPVETLFAFICSANNNIPRIKGMVEKLCTYYGDKILTLDGHAYHKFPEVERLAEPKVEDTLRGAGFGYRAKHIVQTAECLKASPNLLQSLRSSPYASAVEQLRKLPGIGSKVADCICLMALDKPEAVPIDAHIFKIAVQHYLPHLKGRKSLSQPVYTEIGNTFRSIFGPYAGWAQAVLFAADIKK